ncbi:hypothetical protein QCA50_013376 [Cerrena zonata]|uniref:DUF6533 domain-containing protein n=1 Tax=Cerrena zonata TaxID=2478898 RepID=A0AAW0FRY2_9APHY
MSDDFQDIFLGNGGAYVRVASIAIAAYDYLLTLPAEYRFYKAQRSWWVSPGCMLFILIRYISIATLMISNVGYFGSFSERTCHHYFLAAPVFKVIQTMISQVILGIRTYNISKRSQRVLWTMLILFILITAMEWFTNLWDRSHAAAEQQLKQVVPRQIHSAADVSRAMRSQFEHSTNGKDPLDAEYNLKARHPTESAYDVRHQRARSDVELDVQVQIEHTVTVDYLPAALDRETYRSSRSSRWGRDRLSR